MSQQFTTSRLRGCARRLSGYFPVLAALLLTLVAPGAHAAAACNVVYTISPQNSSAFRRGHHHSKHGNNGLDQAGR
jgi:hypothetical protein